MKSYTLFSPVGGHDPIANYHDGALLHICRTYKPCKIYLYLSQEMIERQQQDKRYTVALEKIQKDLVFKAEVHIIERPDLKNVQLFDSFYQDFEEIVNDIHLQNPNDEILLNISSGTPAMKSALNIISTLSRHKVTAVQVATPYEKENPKDEDPRKYDLETFWTFNEDNVSSYKNRCLEISSLNLMAKIKKEMIAKLVHSYNYNAALVMAEDMPEFIQENAIKMLKAAVCRLQLNQSEYTKAIGGINCDFMPIKTGDKKTIFEYMLSLQIKQKQGNYSDFIRAITPVICDLLEQCFYEQGHFDIKNACKKTIQRNDDIVYYLNNRKMEASPQGRQIQDILKQEFGTVEEKPYSSAHLRPLIKYYSKDLSLNQDLDKISDIERNVRNMTAHEIVSVTDEWIKSRCGMTSAEILKLMKRIVMKSGFNIKNEYWDSYENMNAEIEKSLMQ